MVSLGGGPRNATLEVAIYEALRLEADFARAAAVAGLQIALCLVIVGVFSLIGGRFPDAAGQGRAAVRPDAGAPGLKALDGLALLFALAVIGPSCYPC